VTGAHHPRRTLIRSAAIFTRLPRETVWKLLRAHKLIALRYENWHKEGPFCLLRS